LFLISVGFVARFEGSIDFSSAFVDAIVDVDAIDMASFSVASFVLVRLDVVMVDDVL
jgi:hypothetical protein